MRTTLALVIAAAAAMVGLAAPANASWHQPYGGCEEATLAPHSTAAVDCRAHGWTIMRRLAVNPHAVVKGSGLPHCREEDGSSGPLPCSWNFHDGRGTDGNNRGLSYWIGRHGRTHYVWPGPAQYPWHAVGQPLADALAEGVTRRWERCRTTGVHRRVIRVACPNGDRFAA